METERDAAVMVGDRLSSARTFLFVPGNRPDRFAKAVGTGADVVVTDLEDAVGPEHKDAARRAVVEWLQAHPHTMVRINPPGSPWYDEDVAALAGEARTVMLPKADHETLTAVVDVLPAGSLVVGLVETAAGVLHASTLAAHDRVARLALGNVDLGAEIGVDPADRQALLTARSQLVLASAAGGIAAPVDGVTVAVTDADLLRDDVRHAVSLGFGAKLCIHPSQVPVVHEALRPSPAEVDRARRVVAAAAGGGVTVVDGAMIDRPVLLRAEQVLARDRPDLDRLGGS